MSGYPSDTRAPPAAVSGPGVLDLDTIERVPLDQFLDDIARDIYEPKVIAERYGLSQAQAMTLLARPEVTKLLRVKKSIWESTANAPERFRTYCQIGLLEAAPKILSMLQDDDILPAVRVDLVKTLTRVAGVEMPQARVGDLPTGPTGPTFSVNIMFAGGDGLGARTETISTKVEGPVLKPTTVIDLLGEYGDDEEG